MFSGIHNKTSFCSNKEPACFVVLSVEIFPGSESTVESDNIINHQTVTNIDNVTSFPTPSHSPPPPTTY